MRAREMHGDGMTKEKGVGNGIVKFTLVITLNTPDCASELGFDIGKKSDRV
jgi:hypothetical protein